MKTQTREPPREPHSVGLGISGAHRLAPLECLVAEAGEQLVEIVAQAGGIIALGGREGEWAGEIPREWKLIYTKSH